MRPGPPGERIETRAPHAEEHGNVRGGEASPRGRGPRSPRDYAGEVGLAQANQEQIDEEAKLSFRAAEQQEVIRAQATAISDHQQRIHDLKVEQGKNMLPSQRELKELRARIEDMEAWRSKQQQEIAQTASEIEETELSLGFHRSERPHGQPDMALSDVRVRSSYESEAHRTAAMRDSLTRDIVRLKHLCAAHDDQMKKQDQQTARLNQHVAEMKSEYAAMQRALRMRIEGLEDQIDKEDEDLGAIQRDLGNTRKLENAAYQKALMQGRGMMVSSEKDKERDNGTYQKYWEALEHVQRLKADLGRVRDEIDTKESYTKNVHQTLQALGALDSSVLPALGGRFDDPELARVDTNVSYA
mmetsp:Transcript_13417/g.33766  ORF Transcript_13417/g.33766 Transcript_13417/m.33766 type:complete len:357 (+) Transcript_13417:175-1245(+)